MKIFIVDDSEILRQRLKRLISAVPNIQICGEAGNVDDAVSDIKKLSPDVIILDIQLSDGLGFTVFDMVNTKAYSPVWIVLTNYPTIQYQEMCGDRKIQYFFDKTADIDKVVATLNEIGNA